MEESAKIRNAFQDVYREDRWSNSSGPGSLPSSTIEYRSFVESFIFANSVKTITDLGCGDWQFSRFMNWSEVNYVGLDVVPDLIERNNQLYSPSNIEFRLSEGTESLPGGDLLIAKEMLQHLPNKLIAEYLNVIVAKYKYALLTNSVAPSEGTNMDIEPGQYRPLRLDIEPFNTKGAVVFTYFPRNNIQMWRNATFLLLGAPSTFGGNKEVPL